MKTSLLLFILCFSPFLSPAQPREPLKDFNLSDVSLLDSPFKAAEKADLEYMLALDADRLLAPYLREAGLEAKAESYGNWENTGLDGHIGGHYLSALSMMHAATGDQRVKQRLDYMVSELKRAQDNHADGYLGGIPGGRSMWKEIAAGTINAESFSLNKKWVPLYNLHKTYAGLRDAWLYAGNKDAREMLVRLSDWALWLVSGLTDTQVQEMLRSEHGGLNEVFADVSVITGEKKYLDLAYRFSQKSLLEPLLQHEDRLTGMHANTQIPKVIGYKRIGDLDNNSSWNDGARFFWDNVVSKRSVSIGGNSVREHFHPAGDFSEMISSEQGPETCNTYNMLRLTKMLYLTDPDPRYIDYYERALYNHILSSENPGRGGFVYFTPMRPGHYRVYSQPQTSFWCCVGSGLENHAKYGEMIYAHSEDDLYVNLFIPSKLNWKEKGVELIQQTGFPDEEKTSFTFNNNAEQAFGLFIRYPRWVKAGQLRLAVNGTDQEVRAQPGEYLKLNRKWRKGDVVTVELPMHTVAEQLPDGRPYFSVMHGPIVLAAKTDTANMDGLYADDSRGGHIAAGEKYPLHEMPVIVGSPEQIAEKVKPVGGKPLTFTIGDLYPDTYGKLELIPFFRVHESRYVIYWACKTKDMIAGDRQKLAQAEAEKQKLNQETVDLVVPGEQQPESDHFIESSGSQTGINQGRHWRDASGWFSYRLSDKEKEAVKLRVMYFGPDSGRHFNILINGQPIAEVRLNGNKGPGFYTVDYTIPEEIRNRHSGTLTVKFAAVKGSVAGGIYELRLIRNRN